MNALNHDLSPRTATAVAAIPGSYRATGSTRGSAYLRYAKRPLDILRVLVGLPVALTVIVVMALAVACRGGQPFYAQTRIGRDGAKRLARKRSFSFTMAVPVLNV